MSEVQAQCRAAGPVHDECQEDDGENNYHQPEEEHDDPGYRVPAYCSRSSHEPQLPGPAALIPLWATTGLARINQQVKVDVGGYVAPR